MFSFGSVSAYTGAGRDAPLKLGYLLQSGSSFGTFCEQACSGSESYCARALEQMSLGLSAPAVAKIVPLTPPAVWRIGHHYARGGRESALYERQGRGAEPRLEERRSSGSSPWFVASRRQAMPGGRFAWWPSRPSSGSWCPGWAGRQFESCCSATTSSRGGEKMWCVAELDQAYSEKMEAVLAV